MTKNGKNEFGFIGSNKANKEATVKMIQAINEFVKKCDEIEKEYDVGIGDTQTDDDIMSVIYDKLHWRR